MRIWQMDDDFMNYTGDHYIPLTNFPEGMREGQLTWKTSVNTVLLNHALKPFVSVVTAETVSIIRNLKKLKKV